MNSRPDESERLFYAAENGAHTPPSMPSSVAGAESAYPNGQAPSPKAPGMPAGETVLTPTQRAMLDGCVPEEQRDLFAAMAAYADGQTLEASAALIWGPERLPDDLAAALLLMVWDRVRRRRARAASGGT